MQDITDKPWGKWMQHRLIEAKYGMAMVMHFLPKAHRRKGVTGDVKEFKIVPMKDAQ